MSFSPAPLRFRPIATFALAGVAALLLVSSTAAGDGPAVTRLAEGLQNPESVAVGDDGTVYVSTIGKFGADGDGEIVAIKDGEPVSFTKGLDDPKGLVAFKERLFVADKQRVWRIDGEGRAEVFAAADAFPRPPTFLNDLAVDEQGTLYVSDTGDLEGHLGAVFRIDGEGAVTLITDSQIAPALQGPNGLVLEDSEHLLLLDFISGAIQRVDVSDGTLTRFATEYKGGDGLALDANGKLYVSEWTTGRVFVLGKESRAPTLLSGEGDFQSAADICLDAANQRLLVPDMAGGTLSAIQLDAFPAVRLDETPLPVHAERAFPQLEFNRPVVLTHAGDGANRVFVASQLGKVHVFPNKQTASKTEIFLDIEDRVRYKETENEEGFLGLAFHPKFKTNGEFFVFYTTTDAPHTSVISRFRVDKKNPNRADPKSEQELLRLQRPFWNHDGGTLAFGPDGYLYIVLGDGGKANDPFGNGQNLRTLLGKVLRIDVDHKDQGKSYAIPNDNPFLDYPRARGEIWAYGLRNVWRLAFDRQTGACWAADVGQDLWEEVDLIVRGGNYGWNLREGGHPFGIGGVQDPREDLIEPIFEYHHDVGKSITGGFVYRGKRLPRLAGAYLYADYVTGKLHALRYDEERQVALADQPIGANISPVMSFGEDENGEVYFMTTQGWILGFAPDEKGDEKTGKK
ncbi:MAG TPA: PQQ-dependent sugar dehydrogenase [Pirellulales bacterium]|nr:PQQ-dependent sugar dehydrogenase [Pirellulales bacterium]